MDIALPLTDKILWDSPKTVRFELTTVRFGGGNEQSSPEGPDNVYQDWEVTWVVDNHTDAVTIEQALISGKGSAVFTWTPLLETVQKRFKLEGYTKVRTGTNLFRLSASLREYKGL